MSFIQAMTAMHVLAVHSLNVSSGIARGVNPSAYAQAVAAGVQRLGGTLAGTGINPEVTIAPVAGRDRSVITCATNFDVLGGVTIGGTDFNLMVATAFKNSGAGSGLSATRIAMGFTEDSNIGELFAWNPDIARCSADYRISSLGNPRPVGTAGVDSPFGSSLAQVGVGPIAQSNNPARVGQRLPAVGGSLFDNFGALLSGIPLGYKIAAGATLAVGGAVATAYVVRSFK